MYQSCIQDGGLQTELIMKDMHLFFPYVDEVEVSSELSSGFVIWAKMGLIGFRYG